MMTGDSVTAGMPSPPSDPGRRGIAWRSAATILVLLVFCFNMVFHMADYKDKMRVIVSDVICYYNYLPAVYKYKSLEFGKLPMRVGFITDKQGNIVQKTTMGLALLYLPFFHIAYAYDQLSGGKMAEYEAPYTTMICLSAVFYLALGLIFQ
jgi:hypothetical protein